MIITLFSFKIYGFKTKLSLFVILIKIRIKDRNPIFQCLLVNHLWCQSAVLYLWNDPFSIVRRQRENSRKLLTTIISMFPFSKSVEDELTLLKYKLDYHG